jgi:tRNA dimethylallyltransferase
LKHAGAGTGAVQAILIAGPTASGKSALALALAHEIGGLIVNADAMQVYCDLRIITARPTPADEARAPHRLYGHVDAAVNYSAGHYVRDAGAALVEAQQLGRVPIFVGGTGLYSKALTLGLSAVPPIPAETRDAIRAKLAAQGPEALHAELAQRDPDGAARLSPRDRVRIARALEVFEATGRPLAQWHREGLQPLLAGGRVVKLFLAPDRAALYARIDARFDRMLGEGALDEVRTLAARGLDPLLPAMKAHGVPWLIRHLRGEISLAEAADKAKQDTRHYAKRQFTWFRHQLADWPQAAPERALDWLREALAGAEDARPLHR